MLARERVVRAELGEEAYHRAADQILALRVALVHEGVLQLLEGGLLLAAVPGLEGGVEPGVARELEARKEPVGHEVAGLALQQPERLVGLAAPEQQLGELAAGA